MNPSSLTSRAEQYLYNINPLAQRIGKDITATKEAYEGLWNTLSIVEQNQAINETIIQPEVALKYTLKKIELTKEIPEWYPKLHMQTGMKYVIDDTGSTLRWRDEHSAPFSFMTQSQMNLSVIDSNEDLKFKGKKTHFVESPHFSSPVKSQKSNPCVLNDSYSSIHQITCYQTGCYANDLFENGQCSDLLTNSIDSEPSDNIFAKLINKTSLLKLQNNVEDIENLMREKDSDTDKNELNTLVVMSRTKPSDINELTALLETPSSYSNSQSVQLNQEEKEEKSIPKTGFEFLDNW